MDYKSTLLMPKTDFPMRGNLPKREPMMQAQWEEQGLYGKIQEKNAGRPFFILHDGPPYANGNIHMGHALNKILKDFVVRYKSMTGFQSPLIPGWDTHGLPIESAVTNSGVDRKALSIVAFRELCEAYALEQVANQKTQFKRLGVNADWENPYITLHKTFEARQIEVFGKMAEAGLIFKGLKPVYWSPSSESALAEAEIEYQDKRSASIYVAFDVVDGKGIVHNDEAFVIWTTTPWTLPANLGISVNPELDYDVVAVGDKKYIVLSQLVEQLTTELDWENPQVTRTIIGRELEGVLAQHPFYDRTSLVMVGDHVTTEAGTGCVHTAPGHGEDDFIVGKKYGLDVLCPVDGEGKMTKEAPGFEGLFYEDVNKLVTELLTEKGALLKLSFIKHSYPHDWRTKKPVIYRATNQWFASVDKIRDELLEQVKATNWLPSWGETRLGNMMRDRGDWCISRQRVWGVPIPIFYAEDETPIMTPETMKHVADLFREHGSNIWFEREAKDLLPAGFTHPNSPNGKFSKETDIMDVWFDSGSSHTSVLVERGLPYPADLYLEGSDQYRGWFNSSLITGTATQGTAPYKSVLSHGFVLDAKGNKMSKSVGNVVDPLKMMNLFGGDILRLWVATVDYQSDVRISDDVVKQVAESYRKIRNTFRFLLGNTNDFTIATDRVAIEAMPEVHQYMMALHQRLMTQLHTAYEAYEFVEVYRQVINFITNELSAFYLDFTKDILYIERENDHARRSVQTVLYTILVDFAQVLAPFIPHTSDEVWEFIPGVDAESIHLTDMNTYEVTTEQAALIAKWDVFMNVRHDVLKALEIARSEKVIGKSLEAKVTMFIKDEATRAFFNEIPNLKQLFIVSDVTLVDVNGIDGIESDTAVITVVPFEGETCERCWNHFQAEDMVNEYICTRCAVVVEAGSAN
ncbi:MAG: isoleucine--tRNA ligase [Culicoidibacterales bacterium]